MRMVWVARVAWLAVALTPGALSMPGSSRGAMLEGGDTAQLAALIMLWLAWVVVAFGVIVLHPLSLAAVRWFAPMLAVHLAWNLSASNETIAVRSLAAVSAGITLAVVFRAEYSARHVQAAAYGHERRHLLKPPVAVILPSGIVWLSAVVFAAVALQSHEVAVVLPATTASVAVATFGWWRVAVLARRWLVLVPAGIALHDPLMLRDTFMVRRHDLRSVTTTSSIKTLDSLDLTGTTWGDNLTLTLSHPHDVSLSPFGARMTGTLDRVHVQSLRVAPSRLASARDEVSSS